MQSRWSVDFFLPQGYSQSTFQAIHTGLAGLPRNRLWVCVKCSGTWARMVMESADQWDVHTSLCPSCDIPDNKRSAATWRLLPGSLLTSFWDEDFFACLPPDLLAAEYKIHMRAWERENGITENC